jgi:hypothetical protein
MVVRSPQPRDHLLAAYERGELDLSTLSDIELLALNAHLNARRPASPRR